MSNVWTIAKSAAKVFEKCGSDEELKSVIFMALESIGKGNLVYDSSDLIYHLEDKRAAVLPPPPEKESLDEDTTFSDAVRSDPPAPTGPDQWLRNGDRGGESPGPEVQRPGGGGAVGQDESRPTE